LNRGRDTWYPEVFIKSWDSEIGIATGYGQDGQGVGVPSPDRGKTFLLSTSSRPVPGPTEPHIQWIRGSISPGGKVAGA
jgi:hypothetical protein